MPPKAVMDENISKFFEIFRNGIKSPLGKIRI